MRINYDLLPETTIDFCWLFYLECNNKFHNFKITSLDYKFFDFAVWGSI